MQESLRELKCSNESRHVWMATRSSVTSTSCMWTAWQQHAIQGLQSDHLQDMSAQVLLIFLSSQEDLVKGRVGVPHPPPATL